MYKRKENLEVKLKTLEHDINERTDDTVDFKMMGIDHLLVDESHKFKNLMFNTRHDRVAGLGNSQGSQKRTESAFCLANYSRAHWQGYGGYFSIGDYYFQFTY